MARIHPHWTQKWLGRPWVEGRYECGEFVREVLETEFGADFSGAPSGAAGAGAQARDAAVGRVLRSGKVRRAIGQPQEGDIVLMQALHGRRLRGYHIGVFVGYREPMALHLAGDASSVLTHIERLEEIDLTLEGYYRWGGR